MNAHKLIAVALAALLITAGAAAASPGESPTNDGTDTAEAHQPTETGDDVTAADENTTDADANETDSEDARDGNASEGPPTDMPEPVPDHVTTIHQLIRDKLDGDLGNTTLGAAISGVGGGSDEADGQADEESETADENTDEQSSQAQEQGQSDVENAGVAGDLPQQAADQVGAIHDAIMSFLDGDGDNPGDDVSTAASG